MASRNSPASGYAILQKGQGHGATWLCVSVCGPHGGGHGHRTRTISSSTPAARSSAPDAGTHAYGSPLHGAWDKTTIAHNTLTVDELASASHRQMPRLRPERGVDYAMTDAGAIYPGVRFVRTVALLTTNLVVFVDQVATDKPRTLDLVTAEGTGEAAGRRSLDRAVGRGYNTSPAPRIVQMARPAWPCRRRSSTIGARL